VGKRPNELTPHLSPRHYWGAELRAWRLERGLSLDDLGRQIHRDRSYLSKIELAKRVPPRDLADDCDRVLRTGGALVRLHELIAAANEHDEVKALTGGFHVANSGPHVANHVDRIAISDDQQTD
jgi:ribosome-binding protein aMBF1 (putative translation factor)